MVNIAFNPPRRLDAHPVLDARRFDAVRAQARAGQPDEYYVDGEGAFPRHGQADGHHPRSRRPDRDAHVLRDDLGPGAELSRRAARWDTQNVYGLADINADEFWLDQPVARLRHRALGGGHPEANARVQGNPWTKTIAVDDAGHADDSARVGDAERRREAPAALLDLAEGADPALGRQRVLLTARPRRASGQRPRRRGEGHHRPKAPAAPGRRDYVENSNNSYWLANPAHPLEGYARIIGEERVTPGLRARMGLEIIRERLRGTDGLGPKGLHGPDDAEAVLLGPHRSAESPARASSTGPRERRRRPRRGLHRARRLERPRRPRLARRGPLASVFWTEPARGDDPVDAAVRLPPTRARGPGEAQRLRPGGA